MEWLLLLFSLPVLVWIGILGIIVYLIVRRVQSRDQETFEKRDN